MPFFANYAITVYVAYVRLLLVECGRKNCTRWLPVKFISYRKMCSLQRAACWDLVEHEFYEAPCSLRFLTGRCRRKPSPPVSRASLPFTSAYKPYIIIRFASYTNHFNGVVIKLDFKRDVCHQRLSLKVKKFMTAKLCQSHSTVKMCEVYGRIDISITVVFLEAVKFAA